MPCPHDGMSSYAPALGVYMTVYEFMYVCVCICMVDVYMCLYMCSDLLHSPRGESGDVPFVTNEKSRAGCLIKTHSCPSPEKKAAVWLAWKTINPT